MNKKYDFETIINKKGQGSYKWDQMYKIDPNIADNIVPLSVADMELKIAKEIIDGLKKYLDSTILGYTGPYESYYSAVIDWLNRRHNFKVKKEWIVCSNGVVSAIYDCVKAFTKEDDGIIVFTPVYYPFYSSIKNNNRKIIECEMLKNENNYYEIDFEKFEKLASDEKNKLLIFCSPHNPLGRVWKREELKKIGNIALKNNLIIISDEIHSDLIMPNYRHTVLQTLSDELSEITITCTAPTKSFNLAGVGISNIIIKNEKLRKKFEIEQDRSSSHVFAALGYKACELAYNESEKWLDELILLIDKNQKLVHDFFNKNFVNLSAPLIEGTYLQWLDFKSLELSNEELKKFMNEKAKLYFSEGYTFGKNGSGFERINLAAPTWVIKEALDRLYSALKEVFPEVCK